MDDDDDDNDNDDDDDDISVREVLVVDVGGVYPFESLSAPD